MWQFLQLLRLQKTPSARREGCGARTKQVELRRKKWTGLSTPPHNEFRFCLRVRRTKNSWAIGYIVVQDRENGSLHDYQVSTHRYSLSVLT